MAEGVSQAESELERRSPGYLAKVRRLASELGVPRTREEQVRRAVHLVDSASRIRVDAPTDSARTAGRYAKRAVGTLTRFYVVHIAGQVTELGQSTAWMGTALLEYVAELEKRVAALEAEVASLREPGAPGS